MRNKNQKFKIDFIGIGVPRAATTWIFYCLNEHPQIWMPPEKELNFFSRFYSRGLKFYEYFFREAPKESLKGEFSGFYFYENHLVPKRIYKHFPKIKLLLSLRNPIERAWSFYQLGKLEGKFPKRFEEYLKKKKGYPYKHLIEAGFYYQHLQNWLNYFSKEQILIIFYEEIKTNPLKVLRKIYRFLGVKENFVPKESQNILNPFSSVRINKFTKFQKWSGWRVLMRIMRRVAPPSMVAKMKRKGFKKNGLINARTDFSEFEEKSRKYLYNLYFKDIQKLENFLKKDLSIWKQNL